MKLRLCARVWSLATMVLFLAALFFQLLLDLTVLNVTLWHVGGSTSWRSFRIRTLQVFKSDIRTSNEEPIERGDFVTMVDDVMKAFYWFITQLDLESRYVNEWSCGGYLRLVVLGSCLVGLFVIYQAVAQERVIRTVQCFLPTFTLRRELGPTLTYYMMQVIFLFCFFSFNSVIFRWEVDFSCSEQDEEVADVINWFFIPVWALGLWVLVKSMARRAAQTSDLHPCSTVENEFAHSTRASWFRDVLVLIKLGLSNWDRRVRSAYMSRSRNLVSQFSWHGTPLNQSQRDVISAGVEGRRRASVMVLTRENTEDRFHVKDKAERTMRDAGRIFGLFWLLVPFGVILHKASSNLNQAVIFSKGPVRFTVSKYVRVARWCCRLVYVAGVSAFALDSSIPAFLIAALAALALWWCLDVFRAFTHPFLCVSEHDEDLVPGIQHMDAPDRLSSDEEPPPMPVSFSRESDSAPSSMDEPSMLGGPSSSTDNFMSMSNVGHLNEEFDYEEASASLHGYGRGTGVQLTQPGAFSAVAKRATPLKPQLRQSRRSRKSRRQSRD